MLPLIILIYWDVPGGPEVKTLPSNAWSTGSIPSWEATIPHDPWPKKPEYETEAIL